MAQSKERAGEDEEELGLGWNGWKYKEKFERVGTSEIVFRPPRGRWG